jgi:WD40 repeat protein
LQVNDDEPAEDDNELELDMVAEIFVPGGARIKSLLDSKDHWLLMDEGGRILKATLPQSGSISQESVTFTTLLNFHGKGVSKLLSDRYGHYTISCGRDKSIWVHSPTSQACTAVRHFASGVTCMIEVPGTPASGETYLLGHEGGFVRRIIRCADGWKLTHAFRPHRSCVTCICASPDASGIATTAEDGTLFFFSLQGAALTPTAYTSLSQCPVSIVWLDQGIVVGCQDGTVLQVTLPTEHDHVSTGTYEYTADIANHTFQLPKGLWPQKPKKVKECERAATSSSGLLRSCCFFCSTRTMLWFGVHA